MFWKIVKNDFTRKTVITLAVFVFITMAVTLGAGAANIIANLSQSIAQLKQHAMPADIAQMHAGAYAQQQIDAFTREQREHIAMQETMTLLNVEGIAIEYGGNQTLAGTVQDISFAVQNKKFDFLLDLNNEKLDVKEGEVAVPIYFMVANGLTTGDPLTVSSGGYRHDFIISDYVRDYEMNASLASSKRFVVHQADFDRMLENNAGELEYMIEFRLTQNGNAKAVETAYVKAGLPANGPMVGAMVFMLFNALSDVAIAMVIILISILLMMISALCIKLIFLAAIDEDLREIGVMKAMGISKKDIRKVYLTKYRVLSLAAGVLGYLLSFGVVHLFSGNMRLYLSGDLSGNLKYALSLMAPILVYLTVVACCKKTLKKIDGISAVEALRCELTARGKPRKYSFQLLKNRFFSTNIYMGLRDVGTRFKLYRILLVIFAVSVLIVILPLNVYNTMNSPEFSTYMGIGKSDLRIDLRKTDTIKEDLLRLHNDLQSDPDVLHAAAYITCYYQVKNMAGSWDYLSIETGDFSVFPLNYLKGKAPAGEGEISLSFANASKDSLDKRVGDEVIVKVGAIEKTLKVSGIYQDITNGGKTAKADSSLGLNEDAVLWYIVNINVAPGVRRADFIARYQSVYPLAQVNDIREYTRQTLGSLIDQMSAAVISGMAVALINIALITALFLRMLFSKDMSQIAIMRSVGLSYNSIKHQYMAGTMLVMAAGIILGTLSSNFLGEIIVSLALSSLGAAKITFVHIAWQTWFLCPLALMAAVGLTVSLSCSLIVKKDLSVVLRS